jgi:hypothetical protein
MPSAGWYFIRGTPPGIADAPIGNAWAVFESLDVILAAIAAGTIYVAIAGLPEGRSWILPLGGLALLIVASQIIDPPPSISSPVPAPGAKGPDPAFGAWLALAGSLSLVVAGVLSRASVSFAIDFDSGGRGRTRERSATS